MGASRDVKAKCVQYLRRCKRALHGGALAKEGADVAMRNSGDIVNTGWYDNGKESGKETVTSGGPEKRGCTGCDVGCSRGQSDKAGETQVSWGELLWTILVSVIAPEDGQKV